MNWNVIAADDLNDYQVGAIMDALRSGALAENQADPFDKIMQDRCNYIRARLSQLTLSATAYAIPPELKTCACWLIIEAMQTRLPGMALSEDQKTQIQRGYKDLDLAATGDLPITMPDDPLTPVVQTTQGPSMLARDRVYDRDHQDGI